MHKFKNVQVMSNGSINFSYKASSNLKMYNFFEKDCVNFGFNLKNLNSSDKVDKQSFKYKLKYFIKK